MPPVSRESASLRRDRRARTPSPGPRRAGPCRCRRSRPPQWAGSEKTRTRARRPNFTALSRRLLNSRRSARGSPSMTIRSACSTATSRPVSLISSARLSSRDDSSSRVRVGRLAGVADEGHGAGDHRLHLLDVGGHLGPHLVRRRLRAETQPGQRACAGRGRPRHHGGAVVDIAGQPLLHVVERAHGHGDLGGSTKSQRRRCGSRPSRSAAAANSAIGAAMRRANR